MKRKYDEDGYLTHYVFRWHSDLIPDGERYPSKDYFRRSVPSASSTDIEGMWGDGDVEVSEEIKYALLAAWDNFNAELCQRLIDQHGLTIPRCPKCAKILESPMARLCIWCGYSNYDSNGPLGTVESK